MNQFSKIDVSEIQLYLSSKVIQWYSFMNNMLSTCLSRKFVLTHFGTLYWYLCTHHILKRFQKLIVSIFLKMHVSLCTFICETKTNFQKCRFRKRPDFHKFNFNNFSKKFHVYSCMNHMLTIYFSEIQFEHILKTDIGIYPCLIFWKAILKTSIFGIFSKCHWTHARSYGKERVFRNVAVVNFANMMFRMKHVGKLNSSEM